MRRTGEAFYGVICFLTWSVKQKFYILRLVSQTKSETCSEKLRGFSVSKTINPFSLTSLVRQGGVTDLYLQCFQAQQSPFIKLVNILSYSRFSYNIIFIYFFLSLNNSFCYIQSKKKSTRRRSSF